MQITGNIFFKVLAIYLLIGIFIAAEQYYHVVQVLSFGVVLF